MQTNSSMRKITVLRMAYTCLVDGKLSDWSAWDTCSVTCGNGTHSRRRDCIPPRHGGRPCVGDTVETQPCFVRFCPGTPDRSLQPLSL